jgi:serine phosphatase RsbU (regulator of sigma subunit)
MYLKVWGLFPITKNQLIIFETILFIFFFSSTVFLFSYDFPEYIDDPLILFHARYLKYVTLVLSFLIVIETQYYLNKFIGKQLSVIQFQKEKIEFQNEEIKQSIKYASRIQDAVLPPLTKLPAWLEYFIFYKPKDIVSGDFYWYAEKNNKLYLLAGDCTGHGVPGAFMSILGISSLNEIINETNQELRSSEILNKLKDRIINSLQKSEGDIVSEAGMDLALILIDKNSHSVSFSGANNPMFIIRQKQELINNSDIEITDYKNLELLHFKPDKMPIGSYPVYKPFSETKYNYKKGDTLYLFSDGLPDQPGGEFGKKLLLKRFKLGLLKMYEKPMPKQKEILDDFLIKWKNKNDQIDDILVIGIRL